MAVYTEVSDEQIAAFASGYDFGPVIASKGIAEGVENTNYLLLTESGSFILTLYEKRVREADLPFFLSLMEHLAARGVPCPTPVRGRDGEALRRLAGRPAAVVTFLRGMWPRRPSPDHCAAVGKALARLHLAANDFAGGRPNDLSVAGWRSLLVSTLSRREVVSPDLAEELIADLQAIETAWPVGLPSGIIHADLFPDNVFFEGTKVTGIIDFYFSCTDFLAYDLAICLNAWCFEPDGMFNVSKGRRLLSAYSESRPLSPREIESLPILCCGAAMRFLLTRLHDCLHTPKNALVSPKNPTEYVRKLRFHRRVGSTTGYGFE
jgi:homoserine kinase type II